MEKKIAAMEERVRRAKAARDYMAQLVQQAEERAKEVILKKAENMSKIRNLTDQKMILQKRITEMQAKIKDTPDAMQISDSDSSDMPQRAQETDLATVESIKSLIQQIQEFPQFVENAKKEVEQMRTELPAKQAKVRELEAERDRKKRLLQDLLEARDKKKLMNEEKMQFLRKKSKDLDDKMLSFKTGLQDKQKQIEALKKQKQFLEENYKFFGNSTK
ncbi:centrosome-associated protein CEP250-like [Phlebotomus papatasi]|uniref:centrosome-associated protein CEP250-like n=1 Tax=Phlebotomus papatasi TaxID=29031 RepID=UPI00248408DB|nr:centrosome-associated protein CEP250-like [Phlebotomus papatasi]